jgi:hypothetical protein
MFLVFLVKTMNIHITKQNALKLACYILYLFFAGLITISNEKGLLFFIIVFFSFIFFEYIIVYFRKILFKNYTDRITLLNKSIDNSGQIESYGAILWSVLGDYLLKPFGSIFFMGFLYVLGIVLFGSFFEEDVNNIPKATEAAIDATTLEIYNQFNEAGILKLMKGEYLKIYIHKENLMKYPFPERKKPLIEIGCAWCKNANQIYFPKVVFYDVDTGSKLGSYSCFLKYTSLSE